MRQTQPNNHTVSPQLSDQPATQKSPRVIKPLDVDLCPNERTTLRVGDILRISATTIKRSTLIVDSWTHAEHLETHLNNDYNAYESTAIFHATALGTFIVNYCVAMFASKNGFSFFGTRSIEVTVT